MSTIHFYAWIESCGAISQFKIYTIYTLKIRKKHTFCVNWGNSFVNRLVHVCQQYVIIEFDRLLYTKRRRRRGPIWFKYRSIYNLLRFIEVMNIVKSQIYISIRSFSNKGRNSTSSQLFRHSCKTYATGRTLINPKGCEYFLGKLLSIKVSNWFRDLFSFLIFNDSNLKNKLPVRFRGILASWTDL